MEQLTNIVVKTSPDLGPAPDTAASKPHHIIEDGHRKGFRNPHPSFDSSVAVAGRLTLGGFFRLAKTMMTYRLNGKLTFPDTTPPTVAVRKPTFLTRRWPESAADGTQDSHKLRATWLGHACYYVEFPSGLRVLFDPVFEDRCSPFSFMGPQRFTSPPCVLEDLPAVDAVVISHSHYDHLSGPSVQTLRRHHPLAHFFVGLGLADWFHRAGIDRVTELDWWQDAEATVTVGKNDDGGTAKNNTAKTLSGTFSCLPCQHTSARGLFDRDRTLWCSWAVASGGRSVFFGGDTGYRSVHVDHADTEAAHAGGGEEAIVAADEAVRATRPGCPDFANIGRFRGPFDLGLLPIGAYSPRSLFSGMHADPVDSVDIFRDTRCRRAMAIHWGTWALTTEPVLEPPQRLKEALRRRGLPETGVFDVCEIGESREF